MSSEQGTPLITRRRPQKLCPKETNNLDKIEEVIDNFHENPVKQNKNLHNNSILQKYLSFKYRKYYSLAF
uniref:Uncharacterized protein n=1 Tax=Rhizophagus irregularis (strain DAOM 181602 / DAOM 197198 / MUCL 43194) TaxID=747089 RepID=U9UG96_RHIID